MLENCNMVGKCSFASESVSDSESSLFQLPCDFDDGQCHAGNVNDERPMAAIADGAGIQVVSENAASVALVIADKPKLDELPHAEEAGMGATDMRACCGYCGQAQA